MAVKRYFGLTNASAAVALSKNRFIVADDERNYLCIYRKSSPRPLQIIDLQDLFAGDVQHGDHQELDLEGAAKIGDICFWMGSHSTGKNAQWRSARHCLLAMYLVRRDQGYLVCRCGSPYRNLIADLQRDQRYAPYGLDKAAHIAPKLPGGLSIEGLAATPEQSLLIGFRNPLFGGDAASGHVTGGRALVAELLNPLVVMQAGQPRFGNPVELGLDGLGIRDLVWWREQCYLIVAGPYHNNLHNPQQSRLYCWNRASQRVQLMDAELDGLNIEAAFISGKQGDRLQLLSDDGDRRGFHRLKIDISGLQ